MASASLSSADENLRTRAAAIIASFGALPFPGYEMYLRVMADPDHEEHASMIEFYGEPEDPTVPELDTISVQLGRLAKRRAPRPRKPKL